MITRAVDRVPIWSKLALLAVAAGTLALAAPSEAGLVARWKLDDGKTDATTTTAVNSVASVGDGTLNGFDGTQNDTSDGSGWITSEANGAKVDGALQFDGTDDFVGTGPTTASTIGVPTGDAARTVSMWVQAETTGNKKFFSIGNKGANTGDGGAFDFTVEDSGPSDDIDGNPQEPHIFFRHFGGNRRFPGAVLDDWMHVAMVVPDSATQTDDVQVFIDGSESTGFQGNGSVQMLNTNDTEIRLGDDTFADFDAHFDGALDDVQVYDEALGANQIDFLASNPGTVIPEPSSALLLAPAGLLALRRRRRAA